MIDNPKAQRWCGLLRPRVCWVPTRRGWLVFFAVAIALFLTLLLGIHPFLSPTTPVQGDVIAIEGWAPDYAMEQTIQLFKTRGCRKLYVTGCPLEGGGPLVEYKTYAERGAAVLLKLGMPPDALQAVPAPLVRQDRTYTSAIALRDHLNRTGDWPRALNVVTMGPHARRSRVLFQKALGPRTRVGVIALEVRDYDPRRWWTSSSGVGAVIDETVGYLYARLMFRPKR